MSNRGKEYKEQLLKACAGNYVIGAFNVDCLEALAYVAKRAKQEKSIIIFQFGPRSFAEVGPRKIVGSFRALIDPPEGVFWHLDHGGDLEMTRRCISAGFDSVMFDGSDLELGENIARTKQVIDLARNVGTAVEGAVGRLELGVDTLPEDALRFVEETGVDALAVAVGTAHGVQKSREDIDLSRLQAVTEAVGRPLVLHGGSGLPEQLIPEVRKTATAKVNVAAALRRASHAQIQELVNQKGGRAHLSAITRRGSEAIWEVIRQRIELFGCKGRWPACSEVSELAAPDRMAYRGG